MTTNLPTSNDDIIKAVVKEVRRQDGADKRYETLTTDVTLRVTAFHGLFVRNEDATAESEDERLSQAQFCKDTGLNAGTLTKGRTVALYVLGIDPSSAENAGVRSRSDASAIGQAVVMAGSVEAFVDEIREGFAAAAETLGCTPSLVAIYTAIQNARKPETESDPFAQWVAQTNLAHGKGVSYTAMMEYIEDALKRQVEDLKNVA